MFIDVNFYRSFWFCVHMWGHFKFCVAVVCHTCYLKFSVFHSSRVTKSAGESGDVGDCGRL